MKTFLDGLQKHRGFLLVSILYFLITTCFIDQIPKVTMDENWISDTAKQFAVHNHFKNVIKGGWGGEFFYVTPLFVGLFFKVFGISLKVARFAVIMAGFFSLLGFKKLFEQLNLSPKAKVLGYALFLSCQSYFIFFKIVRNEGFIFVFLIWSLVCLLAYHRNKNNRNLFLAGLLSAFSISAHPIGLLGTILLGLYGCVMFVKHNTIKPCLVLGLGLTLGILPLVTNLVLKQIPIETLNRSSFESDKSFITFIYHNFLHFFKSYTLGVKRLLLLLTEIGVLIVALFFRKKRPELFWIGLSGLILFVIGLATLDPFRRRYFILILPFSMGCLVLLYDYIRANGNRLKQWGLYALLFLYLSNSAAGIAYLWVKNHNKTPYSQLTQQVRPFLPNDAFVLSHLEFWFALHPFRMTVDPEAFLTHEGPKFVVMTDQFARASSPITGYKSIHEEQRALPFEEKVMVYIQRYGKRVSSIETRGYSTVEIWEVSGP